MTTTDPTPELQRLAAILAGLEQDTRRAAHELADSEQRRAVEARSGRSGPDWQEVQRRIDAGRTSVEDVFAGRDETPAARRLVALSQRNLAELGELLHADDDLRRQLAELDRDLPA